MKLLRRIIPQLTIGAVRFDLSIMVLLLVAFIGMQLAFDAAARQPDERLGAAIYSPGVGSGLPRRKRGTEI